MAKLIFYLTLIQIAVIGGILEFTNVIPYRQMYIYLPALFYGLLYGVLYNKVTRSFMPFIILIFISGYINGLPMINSLIYLRYIIIPLFIYSAVARYVSPANIRNIIRLCIALGIVQLPVILLQKSLYTFLNPYSARFLIKSDFAFGTFQLANDPGMSLFLLFLIIFILFDYPNNQFVRHKMLLAVWFSVTILFANAIITHIILILVWGYYIINNIGLRTILKVVVAISSILLLLFMAGFSKEYGRIIAITSTKLSLQQDASIYDRFYEGSYARAVAVLYLLNQPLKIFGDGPERYRDTVSGEYKLGFQGQILTFYAEVGILGLLASYWVFFRMSRYKIGRSTKISPLLFFAITGTTATALSLQRPEMIFFYTIFLSTDLLRHSQMPSSNQKLLPAVV